MRSADARREPVEFALAPATRLLWRAPDSVHLELGSRAVVVDGLPVGLVRRIASPVPPAETAQAADRPDDEARLALVALAEAGFLWPRTEPPAEPQADPRLAPPHPRLAGQLAALSVRHGAHAAEVLSARRHATVEVTGRSPLTAHLAAVLAAAGVGRISVPVDGTVRLSHAVPGGAAVPDEGRTLAAAAVAAIQRAAPEADSTALPTGERPDLTVLAADAPIPEERLDALHAADAPHLVVWLGVDAGVVGPLVLPGLTSCVRCADRHRHDRDPAWPALAVQLTVGRRHGPVTDVALATVIAGVAAQQALTFLDGGEPACIDGTIELRLPDWRLRRRSWSVHPACPCTGEPAPPGERTRSSSAQ